MLPSRTPLQEPRIDEEVPFTVSADFDLEPRPGLALRTHGADVAIRRATVPDSLPCADARGLGWEQAGGRLLIRHSADLRFLIEGGDKVLYQANHGLKPDEIGFFLFGSPWNALALQRGLLPLHASAVSRVGAVHAFTGESGAGKSTLAAALGRHGLPFFVDDLLLLDPTSDSAKKGGARCYGGAGLKLFPDALALTDATPSELVCEGMRKRWARPVRRSSRLTGSLETLHVLSYRDGRLGDAGPCAIEPLAGQRAVISLYDALYRKRQALAIIGRRRLFEWLLTVATRHVQVSIFHRPRSEKRFGQGVAHLAAALAEATVGTI